MDYNRFDALYGYKTHQQYKYDETYIQTNYSKTKYNDPLAQAYKILGVDSNINESALKKTYRKLISQHHPDKLVANGLPQEMLKLATEKLKKYKKAYEQVKLAKGWRWIQIQGSVQ